MIQLRSKSYLANLYRSRHLPARQIAWLTEVSRSTALAALNRCGIANNSRDRTHPGHLPFGYNYQAYRLVRNQAEQGVIRLMRQGQADGLSLPASSTSALSSAKARNSRFGEILGDITEQ